jgi:integrase
MGRKSPFILPFLLKRSESGGYVYFRSVPADVRPAISGEVLCSWSGETRVLGSNAAIKVSFNTTDFATARHRWNEIHAQVELVVSAATRRQRADRLNRSRRSIQRVSGLSDQQIKILAARLEHRILKEHEAGLIDPKIRAQAMQRDFLGRDPDDPISQQELRNSEFWHHHREAEYAKLLYREGDLNAMSKPLILSDRQGLVEDPATVEPSERLFEVPDEITEILEENGIELPRDHPDRRKIALALISASQRAHESVMKRMEGDATIPTPEDPGLLLMQDNGSDENVQTLSAAYENWKATQRPRGRTADDYKTQVDRFIALHGDLPINQITRHHVRTFRDVMLGYPRSVPEAQANLPIHTIVAWAKSANVDTLAVTTVNDKAIGALSAIFSILMKQGVVEANPCARMKLKVQDGDREARAPYDGADLQRLFNSLLYAKTPNIPKAARGMAGQWLPLLGIYTGARLEELGQLRVTDVKCEGAIHYFDMVTLNDADGHVRRKTKSSRRNIPIHQVLIDCGFLRYVQKLHDAGEKRLFRELELCNERFTGNWSKWWGRWARQNVSADKTKCFHSFRHLFADSLRSTKCPDSVLERLMGHSSEKVTGRYGKGPDIVVLNDAVQKVAVKGLNEATFDVAPKFYPVLSSF